MHHADMTIRSSLALLFALLLPIGCASSSSTGDAADVNKDYADAIEMFRASASGEFFNSAYGYAIFPTVGKGGVIVGAAAGGGRVYAQGRHIGNVRLSELSAGWQFGGQAFSQIVFFENKKALDEFTSGSFEFGATAQAVAITAGATATSTTRGSTAGASGGTDNVTNIGGYQDGFAVFTIAKGGLMIQVAIAGQAFDYEPL